MATAINQLRPATARHAGRGARPVSVASPCPAPASSPPQRRKHPEEDLQREVVKFLAKSLCGRSLVFHVPNGGRRSFTEAKRFKSMGVLPGMVDLGVINDGRLIGLELKAPKGRVSDTQAWCHARLRACGAPVFICRSLADVVAALKTMGVPMYVNGKFL
jgi:hypothetical protein